MYRGVRRTDAVGNTAACIAPLDGNDVTAKSYANGKRPTANRESAVADGEHDVFYGGDRKKKKKKMKFVRVSLRSAFGIFRVMVYAADYNAYVMIL